MADPETEARAQADHPEDVLILSDPTSEPDAGIPDVAPVKETLRWQSSGLGGLLAGGVIAAALGFGLARFAVPEGWPLAGTKALEAQVAVQNDALATLRADLGALQSALATRPDADQLAVLETELAAAKETLAEVPPQIADLGARLTRLEQLPMADGGISPAALGSLAGDLAALRSEVDAQKGSGVALAAEVEAAVRSANARLAEAEAKAAALKAEAEASTRTATTAAALARVQAAIDSGAPFGAALADLTAADLEVPAVLSEAADLGLPSLRQLQESFPEAARAALEAALRADMGEGIGNRLTSFLRSTTGARSLTPREGTDPDAILSRAEAALHEGAVAAALTEIAALPEPGQQALTAWVAQADRRVRAAEAVAALAATLGKE